MKVETMREQAITLLALWGWEPVLHIWTNGTTEVRLLHRGELRCFSKSADWGWDIWPIGADMLWQWQPCEWARFSTWTLKRCIKLIEERDG